MSTKHGSLPVSVSLIPTTAQNISRPTFLPLPKDCRSCVTGLPNIATMMSAWSLLAGIESLFLMSWRRITGRCKTPIEEIQAAVDGAVSAEQAVKLRQCLNHINELEMHKAEIKWEISRLSDKYEEVLTLIRTIPEFDKNPMTAIQVLSEIGYDMSVFPTAKNLAS